ncbi:hypothetical protein [Roseobacter sp. HKCCA0434]|uniref:hypothetical protein n=1 Tax=Roseobacter sp. HKCCA0434 TaxID=3079297 RepID=UPI0029059893|nr:hypothetical protein [Roseobacter sp. HKCCA0434]
MQVSLRLKRFSTSRSLATLLAFGSEPYLRQVTNGRLSHTEAQRFLSAIVAEEIARLEAERYEKPLDRSASEWLDRVSTERARRAAAEIASARGTAAALLADDEARLRAEG